MGFLSRHVGTLVSAGFVVQLLAATTGRAFPPPCIDFNDNTVNGFTGCVSSVSVAGPTNSVDGTPYLRADDLAGASTMIAPSGFNGDYTSLGAGGCGGLCWDIRIFSDGDGSLHVETPIPQVVISTSNFSPCPAGGINPTGTCTAQFVAATNITEDGGSNPGWHHVCAPFSVLSNPADPLPSNEFGHWQWIGTANCPNGGTTPNGTDWNTLISSVATVYFPVDYTSTPAEIIGFDNFCVRGGRRDHLKCYKVSRDSLLTNFTFTLNTPQFGVEPNCLITHRPFEFCVPACKTDVEPAAPLTVNGDILTNDQLCYKLRCRTNRAPSPLGVEDQFGDHTLALGKAVKVCTPANKIPAGPCGGSVAPQCDGACPPGQACTDFVNGHCKNNAQPCLAAGDCPGSTCILQESHACACSGIGNPTVKQCGVIAGASLCQGACPASAPICRSLGDTCQCTQF